MRINWSSLNNQISISILITVFICICLPDLFAPLVNPTMWRQTQTAMLTDNLLKSGFSYHGAYLNIHGYEKNIMLYEFPLYNLIVASIYLISGKQIIWGKIVSLASAIALLGLLYQMVRKAYSKQFAITYCALVICSPIFVLLSTSYQPDMLGLLLGLSGLYFLFRWKQSDQIIHFAISCLLWLACGVCKFPLLIPFIPACLILIAHKIKVVSFYLKETCVGFFLFLLPLLAWYYFRSQVTSPLYGSFDQNAQMFLIGNLSRFSNLGFYSKPLFTAIFGIFNIAGCALALLGLRYCTIKEKIIFSGVPLYFIMIPTAADQSYYLLPCIPILILFATKGAILVICKVPNFKYLISSIYLLCFIFCYQIYFRYDYSILEAANWINNHSSENEMVFVANTHNRTIGLGGYNPTFQFLSDRTGFNMSPDTKTSADLISQIESSVNGRSKYLYYSWHTKNWANKTCKILSDYLCAPIPIKSDQWLSDLEKRYIKVFTADSYIIFKIY